LKKIRLLIAEYDYDTNDHHAVNKQLFISREVLELGAFLSLATEDYKSFESFIHQLKPFYFDYDKLLPESQNKLIILGVYLLYLLVENDIGMFHTELELVPEHSSRYISFVIELEQDKMEGRYHRICNAPKHVPDACYTKLTEKLRNTVREDILSSVESSYNKLNHNDAQKLLLFEKPNEFETFILTNTNWDSKDNYFHFGNQGSNKKQFDYKYLIHETLNYASELERII